MLPGAHAGAFGRAGAQTGEMLGLADRNDPDVITALANLELRSSGVKLRA